MELYTAGKPQKRYGHDSACMITTFSDAKGNFPTVYEEAVNGSESKKWTNPMKFEVKSLEELETCRLVKLPPGRKGKNWVYETKLNGQGKV